MSNVKEAEMLHVSSYYSNTSVDVNQISNKSMYLATKRAMDIVVSLLSIPFGLMLFILIAALIKIEDPKGSVFFKQLRVGKNEKTFYMYKFRSMICNAEDELHDLLDKNEVAGAMFKMKDDPRVTRVGKFIRKTSLDELPQIWNVIRGNMSLVGPRPPLPREVVQYSKYAKQRLLVTPGCTGLWQIGKRNELTFDEMVELDLNYIQQRGLWLDLIIMIKTIKVFIFPNNAY